MPLDNAGPAWLFCPADRPERFEKAAAAADIVILDLEDGAGDKPAAREALVSAPLNPARTVIRINAGDSPEQKLDLDALSRTDYTTVMLPKCESAEQVTALAPLRNWSSASISPVLTKTFRSSASVAPSGAASARDLPSRAWSV